MNDHSMEAPPSGDDELGTFLQELRKLQNQLRQTATQIMENGTDTAIWETRGGLRMLTMITQQVEARVKQLTTE